MFSESKLGEAKPFMLRIQPESSSLDRSSQRLKRKTGRIFRLASSQTIPIFWLLTASMLFVPGAFGQADFTFQATTFNPPAMNPGGTSLSTVTLGTVNGFSGVVNLSCQVTPATDTAPGCDVSPSQVTPPASASLTVTGTNPTSSLAAAPGNYVVTVTGTGPSTSHQQTPGITVLAVAPGYTITVQSGVVPSSVHAGSGGQATLNINPLNGYALNGQVNSEQQGVWLTCATVAPLVTVPPVCSFDPQPVPVFGTVTPVTLTIKTSAPPTTSRVIYGGQSHFALWFSFPVLGLAGCAAACKKKSRGAFGLLALFVLGGAVLLTPACGSNNSTTNPSSPNATTPKNTYTFTITGVDSNGVPSTNSSTTSTGPTVTLTVN
jgi:hypothetical protein